LAAAIWRGFRAIGIDVSERNVTECLKKGLPAIPGTIESQRFLPGNFDAVTFWDVLEHVPDPETALMEANRILAPGGVLATSCPDFDSWGRKTFGGNWSHLHPNQHLWHFTGETLGKLFVECGFKPVYFTKDPLSLSNFGRIDHMVLMGIKEKEAPWLN
jgi:2-polyprenyl-3-methyl-5-hydroxy-6-metoxy-1,4-benzoquinol methylase